MTTKELFSSLVCDGQTIYATRRSISRSGMQRTLDFYIVKGGEIIRVSHLLAEVGKYRRNPEGEVVIKGCGFDAAIDVIESAGFAMGMKFRREWL